MSRLIRFMGTILCAAVLAAGCTQSAPAPAPTKAPAAPTQAAAKPAEATKPAAAQPTAAPAQPIAAPKVTFPEKGKTITFLVPWAAGGPYDTNARTLAPVLEKGLGVPVQVLNKAGANSIIALTEMVNGKADGYTMAVTGLPTTVLTYLDPAAQATYSRKDFQPVAMYITASNVMAVKADSPYKGLKEMVDAAKAKPESVKIGDTGVGGVAHVATLALEQLTGAKFAQVHFDGGATATTAVLGGHVDAIILTDTGVLSQVKAGEIRILADLGAQRSKFYPSFPTATEQGFNLISTATQGATVKAGTPKEIVQVLSKAFKDAMASPEVLAKSENIIIKYMDTPDYEKEWDREEANAKPLIPLIRR